ncbi:hypothetical protein BCR42DRAFT_418610 [Absidia repens]|uniref:Yeast cell wall synthesis Kre9/Knh1-like N-terminal domain-containing protein n=1 Tax=Absidia repens TaxID=90262 RepID=A0A1X2ICB5_9FUNG|nr:hypothetical protein BCR42DRAFT_418610 [Absidia repens]
MMILSALITFFTYLAYAQHIPLATITAPLKNTAYSAGQRIVISWLNPQVDVISQIQICHGTSPAPQPISVIATNVDAKANGTYAWTIPSSWPSSNDYIFMLGTPPNVVSTEQFTIT